MGFYGSIFGSQLQFSLSSFYLPLGLRLGKRLKLTLQRQNKLKSEGQTDINFMHNLRLSFKKNKIGETGKRRGDSLS